MQEKTRGNYACKTMADLTYIVQSSEFMPLQKYNSCMQTRATITTCVTNDCHAYACTYFFPAYISCVWSYHNDLYTMHHLGYYNLLYDTVIPTFFNILRIRTHEEGRVSLLVRCPDLGFNNKEKCLNL